MNVIFRDRWLLVIDKPHGLPTQPTRDGDDSVFTRLQRQEPYVALHHRLDQPASGLVLFAVDPSVNEALTEAFREHDLDRVYAAVLSGVPAAKVWDRPIEGKPAKTHVEVIGKASGLCAARLTLDTGRTHQIRQHAAFAGTPLLGDRKYGGEMGRRWPRLALHACQLAFKHPMTGAQIALEAPIPADLIELWNRAGGSSTD